MRMRRRSWIFTALLLVCGLVWGQEALVNQIEGALTARHGGGVYDLGHLLKPGGIKELQQRVEQLQRSGVAVSIVTVPRGTGDVPQLAEAIYRDLNMTADEVLIVVDGKQVYGKSLALQGDPQAFQEALKEAQPAFHLYYAKGLAQFARSIADRINQRRAGDAAEQQAEAQRTRTGWGIGLLVVLLSVGAISYPRVRQRIAVRREYGARLHSAEQAFDRITLNMAGKPSEDVNAAWARLDEDLRRCREQKGTTPGDLDKLLAELQAFDRRLAQPPTTDRPS